MINENMYKAGSKRSSIREIFEYAKKRREEIGADKVYDFSLGNPSVPAPKKVNETIQKLIEKVPGEILHGYTSAQGDKAVREKIADNLNKRFKSNYSGDNLYMTCGAAAGLTITFNALSCGGDEILAFAPYFPEYKVFVEGANCKFKVVNSDDNMMPNLVEFEKALNCNVKAVIINSPNNPSGVIYDENIIKEIVDILKRKEEEYNHPIYIVSDEPYRELVYSNEKKVVFIPNYYDDTIICYSYSKSLSLPGERIGYIAVNPKAKEEKSLYAAICGAGRVLGYVCASSLFQMVVAECDGLTSDINIYKRNRDLLYNELTKYGFSCVHPDGAFYLFVKSPLNTSEEFCEIAKSEEVLFVSGTDFGSPGYVRIAYCVSEQQIKNALPAFKKLAEKCKIIKK